MTDTYSRLHRHVFGDGLPQLLERHTDVALSTPEVADIGCGDGSVIWALRELGRRQLTYAIDASPVRVERAEGIGSGVRGLVGDATAVPLPDESIGGVICSQVIEHVPDQDAVAREIARVLEPGGWFYVGSVARRRLGWWLYRRDGRWWLDPTHVREYRSVDELADVLRRNGLVCVEHAVAPVRFAIADLVVRLLVLSRLAAPHSIKRLGDLPWLRRARVRIPGYSVIEVWGEKPSGSRIRTSP
jgi:SAM-dependent methyltransferase